MEKSDLKTLKEDFSKQAGVKSVNPVYIIADGSLEMAVTDEIIVQFKENVTQREIYEMNKRYDVEVKKVTELFQILSVPVYFDPLDVANVYQTSGLVNYSHPNFIAKIELCQSPPSDTYFKNQFYLHNTGQTVNGYSCTAGADINVLDAWDITKGNSDIVIAVYR
jgi:hypothetical protein